MLPAGPCSWGLSLWTEVARGQVGDEAEPGFGKGKFPVWRAEWAGLGRGFWEGGVGGGPLPLLLCLGWGKGLYSFPSLEAGATWGMGGGVA